MYIDKLNIIYHQYKEYQHYIYVLVFLIMINNKYYNLLLIILIYYLYNYYTYISILGNNECKLTNKIKDVEQFTDLLYEIPTLKLFIKKYENIYNEICKDNNNYLNLKKEILNNFKIDSNEEIIKTDKNKNKNQNMNCNLIEIENIRMYISRINELLINKYNNVKQLYIMLRDYENILPAQKDEIIQINKEIELYILNKYGDISLDSPDFPNPSNL